MHAFDDYLIYNDTTVFFHVHWEISQRYLNNVTFGLPGYGNITGQAINQWPSLGPKLLRGYELDKATQTLKAPQYVRNPRKMAEE